MHEYQGAHIQHTDIRPVDDTRRSTCMAHTYPTLGLAVGVARVDEGAVARLGVRGRARHDSHEVRLVLVHLDDLVGVAVVGVL